MERHTPTDETTVLVIVFTDLKGSTLLKETITAARDEAAFQRLRQEHDTMLREIITREGAGEIIKTTGDGCLAVFTRPSTAVERCLEIQERLHAHPHLAVRIGMDMGEVRVEYDGGRKRDVFGRHVDWAARAMALAEGGHVCVTRSVYTDAFSWITKTRIAWKEHGAYRVKPGETPLEIWEPYNANIVQAMDRLAGEKAAPEQAPGMEAPSREAAPKASQLRLVRTWEAVARDGRDFAENGAGIMYWFKVPLGGVSYPEGFRNFLQPALANPRITKVRFVLDSSVSIILEFWDHLVLPLVSEWAERSGRPNQLEKDDSGGHFQLDGDTGKSLGWAFADLSREFTPCFKLLVPDPDTDEESPSRAQVFLSTAARTVRFKDGSQHTVRIPDAVLRVEPDEDALLHALNSVANQWDSLFR